MNLVMTRQTNSIPFTKHYTSETEARAVIRSIVRALCKRGALIVMENQFCVGGAFFELRNGTVRRQIMLSYEG